MAVVSVAKLIINGLVLTNLPAHIPPNYPSTFTMDDPPPEASLYHVLPTGSYIRALHLLPGSNDDPLQCTLQTTLMSYAQYEAISYVWGSGIRDHSITCDGRAIPITANLHAALRHLRSNTTRILWADSLCIDQENHKEKADQVAMMGQIYRAALRVLLVIGDNDFGFGAAAQSLVTEISTMVRETLQECGATSDSFPWPEVDAPIVSDARWPSFNLFLSQDWFRRGWVSKSFSISICLLRFPRPLIVGQHIRDWVLRMTNALIFTQC